MFWFIWFGFMFLMILWRGLILVVAIVLWIWNLFFPLRKVDVQKVIDYLNMNEDA